MKIIYISLGEIIRNAGNSADKFGRKISHALVTAIEFDELWYEVTQHGHDSFLGTMRFPPAEGYFWYYGVKIVRETTEDEADD